MLRVLTLLSVAVVAGPAIAATTIQQDFDAAQALLDAGKSAEARDAFTALLGRFSPASKGTAISLVRARLGSALLSTGDPERAETLLAAAVAGLGGTTARDAEERGVTTYDLGRAYEMQGRLDSAAEQYRRALATGAFQGDSGIGLGVRAGLARTLIWADPAEARRLVDAMLLLPKEKLGDRPGDMRGLLESLRGRIELNDGNPAEARRWFTTAASSAGGATSARVSIADVRIRGDLMLANFKLGNMGEVQKFAALSGAGASESGSQALPRQTPVPGCAPLTGLSKDAMAVVEFAIGSDGRVTAATPIYATRGTGTDRGEAADEGPEVLFVQAVRRWVWSTDEVAKLDPFWRQAVRVEMRCFDSRPGDDPVGHVFDAEAKAWLAGLGVRALPDLPDNDAVAMPLLRAELAQREANDGAQSAQLMPVLVAIAMNEAAPNAERQGAAARWLALTKQYRPPLAVQADFRLTEIMWEGAPLRTRAATLRFKRDEQAKLLAEIDAAGQGDSRVAMLVRLRLGETLAEMRDRTAARGEFERIVASPEAVLPAADLIRTSALLRISNLAAAANDMPAAAIALAATGLTPEQCSLIDVQPEGINNKISTAIFSEEARRWRNSGIVRTGFDITADGRTTNVRTVVASPPFIYSEATTKAFSQFRYRPVFRPGNTLGCTGKLQPARFRVLG